MSREIVGRHYRTAEPIKITLVGDKISSIAGFEDLSADQSVDQLANLPWIAPGLVDLQVNGYAGVNFTLSGDVATAVPDSAAVQSAFQSAVQSSVDQVTAAMREVGVTRYLPTVTTASAAELTASLSALAPTVSDSVIGFHLEGPYISSEDGPRGAHPKPHVRPPNWEEFCQLQEAAGGNIKLLTLSPEYEGAPDFIRKCVASGTVVAIGHTSANNQQIYAAVDAGARLSTHLGNGAAGTIRRHPNYLWTQLDEPRLTATLIADGHHLPPEVFRVFVAAKSLSRCVLVSDVTCLGGMPEGQYLGSSLGDVEVLPGGKIVIAGQTQYLAGASARLLDCVTWAADPKTGRLAWADAWDMASVSAATVMGLPSGLTANSPADLVVLDPGTDAGADRPHFRVLETLVAGKTVYQSTKA